MEAFRPGFGLDDREGACAFGVSEEPVLHIALIAAVGQHFGETGVCVFQPCQHRLGAGAVMRGRAMHRDGHGKSQRIHHDMPLAPGDFLAAVIALVLIF